MIDLCSALDLKYDILTNEIVLTFAFSFLFNTFMRSLLIFFGLPGGDPLIFPVLLTFKAEIFRTIAFID